MFSPQRPNWYSSEGSQLATTRVIVWEFEYDLRVNYTTTAALWASKFGEVKFLHPISVNLFYFILQLWRLSEIYPRGRLFQEIESHIIAPLGIPRRHRSISKLKVLTHTIASNISLVLGICIISGVDFIAGPLTTAPPQLSHLAWFDVKRLPGALWRAGEKWPGIERGWIYQHEFVHRQ